MRIQYGEAHIQFQTLCEMCIAETRMSNVLIDTYIPREILFLIDLLRTPLSATDAYITPFVKDTII